MGLFDFLKTGKTTQQKQNDKNDVGLSLNPSKDVRNSPSSYVDGSSIAPDEKPFYRPDNYYTYYSYPGSEMARRVITFEERKHISYPSSRGLYVAEIMLLEYCSYGKYPKPSSGYPGLWWFEFGIRDVGMALQSLERRGYIRWATKYSGLNGLKVEDLKRILTAAGLSNSGKKTDLVERIKSEIPEQDLIIPNYIPKYELTELGKTELNDNGYIPYMYKHRHSTTEDDTFGEQFNVWSVNKLFPNGDARNWRQVVGDIEEKRFGVNMANSSKSENDVSLQPDDFLSKRDEMREFLASKQSEIANGISTPGNGFDEESRGIDYRSIGKDKEALVMFYISIGKRFDAPGLYRETSVLLRKYGMYEEELSILDIGLQTVSDQNWHWKELAERKAQVVKLIGTRK